MKKLLAIITLLLICSNYSFADDGQKAFVISCEGEIRSVTYGSNKKDIKRFSEDLKLVAIKDEKDPNSVFIFAVEIEDSSAWYKRDRDYLPGHNFKSVSNGKTLIMESKEKKDNEGTIALKRPKMRLSLENGTYTGSWILKWLDGSLEMQNTVNAVCSGTDKVLAYYKNQKSNDSLPNLNDDEIIPAASGTGFFVSRKGHIVTNHHVIDGCSIVKAIHSGKEFESEILAVDKVNDLAILKSNIRPKKVYAVSNEDGQLLEEVIVAGYPLGKKISAAIKATSGTVTALAGLGDNYAEFQTDAALNSGNSGGPIINEYGNVIGVAVSKIQQEGVESFNFGIKSSVLKIFANANGISFLPPNRREMKKKDLGILITEGTIYLDCWMTGKQIKKIIASNQTSQKAFYSEFVK